jgi:predicted aspartyl protease
MVNGEGPFRFVVDTGANRSALSQNLADRLGVAARGMETVHSIHGSAGVDMVENVEFRFGSLPLGTSSAPVFSGQVLAGEEGLLGVDGLKGRELRMDFASNCIEILPASVGGARRGWQTIEGTFRFGHLVVADGVVAGVRTMLIIDTGSEVSLSNMALRNRLEAHVTQNRVQVFTLAERAVLRHAIVIPTIRVGEIEIRNTVSYFGDFYIFDLWELSDTPAMLVGMDVLSQLSGLAINYETGMISLDVRARRGNRRGPSVPGILN